MTGSVASRSDADNKDHAPDREAGDAVGRVGAPSRSHRPDFTPLPNLYSRCPYVALAESQDRAGGEWQY